MLGTVMKTTPGSAGVLLGREGGRGEAERRPGPTPASGLSTVTL